ncbi:MAG: PHP domain-containing protein [Clostridia bacterium]|nr:PHP domain-containing protein [Clostridia bacterium]
MMVVDLHVHTTASSDGDYTPREIVEMAVKKKIRVLAITDHDSVAAVEAGIRWGVAYNVEVIPGCELFTQYQGRFLHILGYYIDPRDPDLVELCERSAADSVKRIDLQIKALREGGFYLEKEKVLEQCQRSSPLYSNYVQAIFEDARNSNNPVVREYQQKDMGVIQFCRKFMCMGKEFYIPQFIPEAEEVLNIIRKSGGISVLAHPGVNLKKEENFIIDDLVRLGLAGLEVYTSHHQLEDEKFYADYCKEHQLIYTSGSDFHGSFKPKVKLGEIKNNSLQVVEMLKKAVREEGGKQK